MYVNVGDVRLHFDVDGEQWAVDGGRMRRKPTLLLLHGGPGSDHSYFKPAFARLRDVAQLVYLDQRGNGRSDAGEPRDWNLAQWGDDVRAFCDALGIVRPIVLGVSFGGIVAMAYATRHPGHPGALVLSSTQARVTLQRTLAAFERLGGAPAREAARRFWTQASNETLGAYARLCWPLYTHAPRDPDVLTRQVARPEVLLHFARLEDGRFDLRAALAAVRCPTLVLAGEDDPITPIDDARDIVRALPSGCAAFEAFPKCGHGIFQDAPEAYFARVRAFIEEVAAREEPGSP